MDRVQDAYYLDSKPYAELSKENKEVIDKAVEKLKEWESMILMFDGCVLNIISSSGYTMLIQSEFPDDLTGKMVYAYTQSKSYSV